ncbi:hypothetical protein N7460_012213 [Penicillium canescens]|uniref:Uncharacterized protein n=1 Tax=Penicillium canescens TaxID=5083 RepID=A0AAD6I1T5_PENCN|nr:hypothetical protein N7460_012213 [Penicillium canescens]
MDRTAVYELYPDRSLLLKVCCWHDYSPKTERMLTREKNLRAPLEGLRGPNKTMVYRCVVVQNNASYGP